MLNNNQYNGKRHTVESYDRKKVPSPTLFLYVKDLQCSPTTTVTTVRTKTPSIRKRIMDHCWHNPEDLKWTDHEGNTPLHMFCRNHISNLWFHHVPDDETKNTIISSLSSISQEVGVISHQNYMYQGADNNRKECNESSLIEHVTNELVSTPTLLWLEVIDVMIQKQPNVLFWKNIHSQTPLHCALYTASQLSISCSFCYSSSSLLHQGSSGTKDNNNNNNNNNRNAFWSFYYKELILRLIRASPELVTVSTHGTSSNVTSNSSTKNAKNSGNYWKGHKYSGSNSVYNRHHYYSTAQTAIMSTPFHMACDVACLDYDVLQAMLEISPQLMAVTGRRNKNVCGEVTFSCDGTPQKLGNPKSNDQQIEDCVIGFHSTNLTKSKSGALQQHWQQNDDRNTIKFRQPHDPNEFLYFETTFESTSPILLLWNAYSHHRPCRCRCQCPRLKHRSNCAWIRDRDRKMELLVTTAHRCIRDSNTIRNRNIIHSKKNSNSGNDNSNILHAICSVYCPKDYISYILNKQEHQSSSSSSSPLSPMLLLLERNVFGETPLHCATRMRCTDVVGWKNTGSYQQHVIATILGVCPQAASIPNDAGRLPIHLALSSTTSSSELPPPPLTWHKGGVRELALAHPAALRQPDPVSGLLPFLAAATASSLSALVVPTTTAVCDYFLTTIYELLLAAPDTLSGVRLRNSKAEDV